MREPSDSKSNRFYTITLTFAVMLFLITLTIVVVVIIISSARSSEREDEFNATLTAAFSDVRQTEVALGATPSPAPPVVYGQYPFAVADGSPTYTGAPSCDSQVITGLVLDSNGNPTDAYDVQVWGDYIDLQIINTGPVVDQESGRWSVELTGMVHRRIFVQLSGGQRFFSPPIEIDFDATDCASNQADIVFQQIAALNG